MAIANAVDAGTAGYQSLTSAGVWNGRTFQAGAGISLTNADGTAGNTTITATGGSAGVNSTLDFQDDFIYGYASGNSTTAGGDTTWSVVGGATPTTDSARPGLIKLGANNSIIKTPNLVLGGGILTFTAYIKLDATATTTYLIGLADATSTSDFINGVYFFGSDGTNSGNWVGKTANASTRSSANSAVPISTSWIVLQIIVNAAANSVAYYTGATKSALTQIANSPLTTNIPTVAITPCICTGGNSGMHIDLVTMTYALTTAR